MAKNDEKKNPYPASSPEFQLWEMMRAAEARGRANSDDADRSREKAKEAFDQAEAYRAALEKLKNEG